MNAHALPPLRITDPIAFGRVAVLMGGTSSEREVSLDSGRNVLEALRARGIDAHPVDGIPALAEAIRAGRDGSAPAIDRVFNILHGNNGGGEDGVLQGLLQALDVPCTGSGVLGSALSMDKIRSKQVWLSLGLPTPTYVRLADSAQRSDDAAQGSASATQDRRSPAAEVHAAARTIGLPVIVKPACEGSSVGITRVFTDADLDAAVALAAQYRGELLMEQLVEGDELTVAVLGGTALPSIRIVPKGQWYDYHAKYVAEDTQYLCPGLDGGAESEIRQLALDAFNALDCSGWGRVDVMRDRASGRFFLLEVNTAPGMTSHSLVPKAARELGVEFDELCWRILEATLAPEARA